MRIPRAGVTPPRALTVAGSDSGGGAGIQADLRTFLTCGVHGMTAITAVTTQNSLGVTGITELSPETVVAQMESVVTDIGVNAAKTGMLASAPVIEAVDEACGRLGIGATIPLVIDPVAASMHGDALLRADALTALTRFLRRATLITPNLDEVRLLTGITVDSRATQYAAARALAGLGPSWVLVKGGHLTTDPTCVDLLFDGTEMSELPAARIDTPHTHGGGDTMASAITSALAQGLDPPSAVAFGKRYVTRAVAEAYPLGAGVGPVSPFWRIAPDL